MYVCMKEHVCPSIDDDVCGLCGGTKPAILFCAALDMNTVIPFTENLLPLTEQSIFKHNSLRTASSFGSLVAEY
jgi:hypothetical protein